MKKTWNITLYRDGEAVAHRRGVSHADAISQIYRFSRTEVPVEEIANDLAPSRADLVAAA